MPGNLLTADVFRLAVAGLVILLGVLIGQAAYRVITTLRQRVKPIQRHVAERKRPSIQHVLVHIFWAPVLLITVLGASRTGLSFMEAATAARLAPGINTLLLLALLWTAIRVIRTVIIMEERR